MALIPTTDIAICNLSLAHLGQSPIVSLEDANESARSLNRVFAMSRYTALRAKDWKFASVKAALNEVSGQDIPGWEYVYTYPPYCACVRKLFIDTESQDPPKIEFDTIFIPALAQKVIVANYDDAYINYTYLVDNPALYDHSFVMALSFLLAAQVAKPLTANDDIAKLMMQFYISLVGDAARINDGECYKKPTESSSIEDSRG